MEIARESNALGDSMLLIEKDLSKSFNASEIKSFVERNNQVIQTYSDTYVEAYNAKLNGMSERRFKFYILCASLWCSAWIDAGQQKLTNMTSILMDIDSIPYQNRPTLGWQEWH